MWREQGPAGASQCLCLPQHQFSAASCGCSSDRRGGHTCSAMAGTAWQTAGRVSRLVHMCHEYNCASTNSLHPKPSTPLLVCNTGRQPGHRRTPSAAQTCALREQSWPALPPGRCRTPPQHCAPSPPAARAAAGTLPGAAPERPNQRGAGRACGSAANMNSTSRGDWKQRKRVRVCAVSEQVRIRRQAPRAVSGLVLSNRSVKRKAGCPQPTWHSSPCSSLQPLPLLQAPVLNHCMHSERSEG